MRFGRYPHSFIIAFIIIAGKNEKPAEDLVHCGSGRGEEAGHDGRRGGRDGHEEGRRRRRTGGRYVKHVVT